MCFKDSVQEMELSPDSIPSGGPGRASPGWCPSPWAATEDRGLTPTLGYPLGPRQIPGDHPAEHSPWSMDSSDPQRWHQRECPRKLDGRGQPCPFKNYV